MKVKEFKKTEMFKMANIVQYFCDGKEIELPTSNSNLRRFYNREIESASMEKATNNLFIARVFLKGV